MSVLDRNNLLKKLAGILGVATLGSLIGLPVFAQLNTNSNSNSFRVAQNSSVGLPGETNIPSSTNSAPDTSTTPDTRNNPASSSQNQINNNSRNTLSTTDRTFILQAARDGMAEVALSQLALQRGSSDAVKEYARMMVNDHTRSNGELASLAAQKGVSLPTDIGEQNRAIMRRLSGLSGARFDQAYMSEMIRAHNKDLSSFQRQARQGQDRDLRAWAAQKVPTLQAHLQTASNIARR